jgi:hypothetical protein
MNLPSKFPLLSLFMPKGVEYCQIGSRRYMNAPNSDYDVMFHPEDRHYVIEHLSKMGVDYIKGNSGSIKFSLEVFPTERFFVSGINYLEVNYCFIEDYEAWRLATEAMLSISKITPTYFDNRTKWNRLKLFSGLVASHGGQPITLSDPSY